MLDCCSWSKSSVSHQVSDATNASSIVDVIAHCKQGRYDLAKAKLATTSDQSIIAVMRDRSFLANLKALGIKQPPGQFYSGPHTVYSIRQGLADLIEAKCPAEVPPIQASMHPNSVVVAPVRSQPVATRPEQLRSIIAENRTDHREQIEAIRDDAVKQFEEAGLYNQLNDSALSHQVAVAKEEVEIAKRKREMAQIHADNMKAKQAQLATLRQQRETLDACDRLNITPDELRLQKELDAMRIELGKLEDDRAKQEQHAQTVVQTLEDLKSKQATDAEQTRANLASEITRFKTELEAAAKTDQAKLKAELAALQAKSDAQAHQQQAQATLLDQKLAEIATLRATQSPEPVQVLPKRQYRLVEQLTDDMIRELDCIRKDDQYSPAYFCLAGALKPDQCISMPDGSIKTRRELLLKNIELNVAKNIMVNGGYERLVTDMDEGERVWIPSENRFMSQHDLYVKVIMIDPDCILVPEHCLELSKLMAHGDSIWVPPFGEYMTRTSLLVKAITLDVDYRKSHPGKKTYSNIFYYIYLADTLVDNTPVWLPSENRHMTRQDLYFKVLNDDEKRHYYGLYCYIRLAKSLSDDDQIWIPGEHKRMTKKDIYLRCIELCKKDALGYINLACILSPGESVTLPPTGESVTARDLFKKAIEVDPFDYYTYFGLGTTMPQHGSLYIKAKSQSMTQAALYNEAIKLYHNTHKKIHLNPLVVPLDRGVEDRLVDKFYEMKNQRERLSLKT